MRNINKKLKRYETDSIYLVYINKVYDLAIHGYNLIFYLTRRNNITAPFKKLLSNITNVDKEKVIPYEGME